jgi:hypothetical protein
MRPWDAKALVRPLFIEDGFTATKWDTAPDKAWFANGLCKFIAADFAQTLWTKRLYRRLSLRFGHIAHYSDAGFWGVFFTDTQGKLDFLDETMRYPCYGDPTYTYCDVERAIQARLQRSGIVPAYQALRAAEIEAAERAALAKLRAKYEGAPVPAATPQNQPPILPPPQRGRRNDPPPGQATLL